MLLAMVAAFFAATAAGADEPSPLTIDVLAPGQPPARDVVQASREHYIALGASLEVHPQPPSRLHIGPQWVRLTLAGDAPSGQRWYLRASKLRHAVLFTQGMSGWLSQEAGVDVPYVARAVPSVLPTFEVVSDALARGPAYLRIDDSAPVRLVLFSSDRFERVDRSRLAFFGLFFGILIAVGLYHILMFALLRNLELLAYAVYVAALLAEELVRTGYAAAFLWPGASPDYVAVSSLTFAFLAVASFWFFTTFLQMRARAPRSYRAIAVLTGVVVAMTLGGGFLRGPGVITGIQLLSLVTLLAVLIVAINLTRKGDRAAAYFIVAFSGVLGGTVLYVAGGLLAPASAAVDVGFEIGTAFEAIALALGVADRIKRANEERDRAQQRVIEETRSLNVAYARFVPRTFLELLGKSDVREVALGDQVQREMTVLFSDIRSFTSLSEKMTPRETFDFINAYLERVGPIVREHDGVIDKYIGDAIMGLFSRGADDGLRCAIEVQREVVAFNAERSARGQDPIAIGVGLHTGPLMLGTIGEHERMDGTVIADAVNLASRMESLTKRYGAEILLSEDTRNRLVDPTRYAQRYLGRVAVKGKARGVGVYECYAADAPEALDLKTRTSGEFALAVSAFVDGQFKESLASFDAVLSVNRSDRAADYLRARCEELLRSGEAWDGVDHMLTK
ncbi:MAG: hypothetical protein JOY59_01675 [Candidatus Eremiobacteraeota bacterium]|nr:hypothetical protein [Candidatus Eremiobacteraeota bacterium]